VTTPLDNPNMPGFGNPQFGKLDGPFSAGMLPLSSSNRIEVRISSTQSKISNEPLAKAVLAVQGLSSKQAEGIEMR
jgi:hypothetical protein